MVNKAQTLDKNTTLELVKYLETALQKELRETDEGDKLLKLVITGDFTLITLCSIEEPDRRIRSLKDFELLYCSSKKYQLSNDDYIFQVNKHYEKVGFYRIPKKFFPEYFL